MYRSAGGVKGATLREIPSGTMNERTNPFEL